MSLDGSEAFFYSSLTNTQGVDSQYINLNGQTGILKGVDDTIEGSSTTDDLPEGKTNLYFTDARTRGAFTAGTGIVISTGGTISNTGVLSLTGTAGRVSVSGSTGNITLSGPQDIDAGSTPSFAGLTLTGTGTLTAQKASLSGAIPLNLPLGNFTNSILYCDSSITGDINPLGISANLKITGSSGLYVLDTKQNIQTTSTPTFAGLTLGTLSGVLKATTGTIAGSATTDDLTEGKTNLYFTNARAQGAFSAGTGISITSGVITNTAPATITSITGTANQINVSGTGALTLSTPQDIGTSSSPQFARLINSSVGTRNLLLGSSAGGSITTSVDTVAIGNNALSTLSTAINCTAIGSRTLSSCNANNNTAVGFRASEILTSGFQNTTVGAFAGALLTSGKYNSLFAMSAGGNISTGDTNFCLGLNAGYSITTSSDNIAIGAYTMAKNLNPITTTNGRNVAIGHYASHSLEGTPANNITIGYQSLYNATSCSDNICIGTNAGNSITTGGGNIAIGGSSLSTGGTLTAGQGNNIGVGIASNLYVSAGATNNIGIGAYSNFNTSTGSNNISIGPFTQATANVSNNNIVISTNGTSSVPISGKGNNTAFIDARFGLFSYSPAYCVLVSTAFTSGGLVQWTFHSDSTTTYNFGLFSLYNSNTLIVQPYAGLYEISITGNMLNNTNFSSITYNVNNIGNVNLAFNSPAVAGYLGCVTGTSMYRPYVTSTPTNTGITVTFTGGNYYGPYPARAVIKFISL